MHVITSDLLSASFSFQASWQSRRRANCHSQVAARFKPVQLSFNLLTPQINSFAPKRKAWRTQLGKLPAVCLAMQGSLHLQQRLWPQGRVCQRIAHRRAWHPTGAYLATSRYEPPLQSKTYSLMSVDVGCKTTSHRDKRHLTVSMVRPSPCERPCVAS